MTVGTLVRDGFGGPDACHALYCASPRTGFAGMSIPLTARTSPPAGVMTVGIDSPGTPGHY
ncbi:hypothetical protein ABT001_25880 [Streptomyces sp. NPDC002793]|uniref:hypothetical protein n=1 Tax=Streptomyces sp. NPDC002793 TaxID=3154432 RepID=UPI00331BF685